MQSLFFWFLKIQVSSSVNRLQIGQHSFSHLSPRIKIHNSQRNKCVLAINFYNIDVTNNYNREILGTEKCSFSTAKKKEKNCM